MSESAVIIIITQEKCVLPECVNHEVEEGTKCIAALVECHAAASVCSRSTQHNFFIDSDVT